MAHTWAQRLLIKSSRYLQEAFSEPGVLETFQEELFSLRSPAAVKSFRVLTDQEFGGLSTADLRFSTEEGKPEGCLVFEGEFNSQVPREAPSDVHRLGQAAFGSKTLGSYLWLGQYDRQVASTINYSLKGDGRLYGVYMKTDSYVEGLGVDEIWQAVVQTKEDEWQDINVPVVDFLLTAHGYLPRERRYINLRRVTGLGFSVAGGREVQPDGPFKLCVSKIEAGFDDNQASGIED